MENISFKGLRYLKTFHKLCGISYLGASIDSENRKNRKLSNFLSIIWNLIFFGLVLKYLIEFLKEKLDSIEGINSSKLLITFILRKIGMTGYYVQSFSIR